MDTTEPFLSFLQTISIISYDAFDQNAIILSLVSLLLLVILALVSGAEDAFFAIVPAKIRELKKDRDKKNNTLIKLLESPQKLKATIFIIKNFFFVAIFISIIYFIDSVFIIKEFNARTIILIVGFIFLLTFLFKDIISKGFVRKNKFEHARIMAKPFYLLHRIFLPFSNFLVNSTTIITKKILKKRNITIDELSDALNLTSKEIQEDENILRGIIKFGNITAKEIMKSRVDVFAVDINTDFDELMKIIIDSGHSRIPVYENSFDNVRGILYIKDLLPYMMNNESFRWQDLIRPTYFVPETKKINNLLKEFQYNKIHIAIVIDEYGGTYGIVTLEDILEEIVGEITDESDNDEIFYSKESNDTYVFEGKTLLNDFYKILNLSDDFFDEIKRDADTIAGIILEIKGEIPKKNDVIRYKNLAFKIESSDKRRIKKVKVIIE
ncbi:MAG: gliding motility-associated protein GldE [Bacteroidota bacterium]